MGALDLHDREFDEVRWAPVAEALALLTHATERSMVERAVKLIDGVPDAEATG